MRLNFKGGISESIKLHIEFEPLAGYHNFHARRLLEIWTGSGQTLQSGIGRYSGRTGQNCSTGREKVDGLKIFAWQENRSQDGYYQAFDSYHAWTDDFVLCR
jgi:hypothetical protein